MEKRNGKGKEYFDGKLEFEGEYLNGKQWNGKGFNSNNKNIIYKLKDGKGNVKEYEKYGKLKFEGEFLNGKRNGKGKEYYSNEILKFEGEYLNDKRNGKGKEYEQSGKLIFEGIYLNDKRKKKLITDIKKIIPLFHFFFHLNIHQQNKF